MSEEPLEQMKIEFIAESLETIQNLSRDLAELDPTKADSQNVVNALFRKAHSLKGTAGMFDLVEVGRVAAVVEDVLEKVRSGATALGPDVVEIVLDALDEIVLILREAKGEDVEADADGVIGRMRAFLGGREPEGEACLLEDLKLRLPPGSLDGLMSWEVDEIAESVRAGRRVVHVSFALEGKSFSEVAGEVLPELEKYGKVLGVPPPAGQPGGAAFALLVAVKTEDGGFDRFVAGRGGTVLEGSCSTRAQTVPAVEQGGAAQGRGGKGSREGGRRGPMSVKVDLSRLDAVMNSISELYAVRFKLAALARGLTGGGTGRKERDELLKFGLLLDRRITEIETVVLEARLVPVSTLFNRYTGEIRRLARKQGKKIDLVLEGEATLIDRALLEEVYDPVLHLIRNAVDHGIEAEAERRRRGKPATGRVTLRARQESNHVRIDIEDDGAGLDFEKMEKMARARGMERFSRDDLVGLLFEPGVSTRDEVTDISGRGVGLDEVKVHIESLRGVVSVESRPGEGTCFSLLVPLTLAVSRGVVVEEGDVTAVLPLTYVEEIIPYRGKLKREIEEAGSAATIRHGRVGAFDLADMLGARRHEAPRSIVIIGVGDVRHAIVVERVWGETDIATRPLPDSMQAPPVIAGATELHDRRPAVVVQPEPLFRTVPQPRGTARKPARGHPPAAGRRAPDRAAATVKMGLFERNGRLVAVPLSILSQVVPMRSLLGVPAFGETWEGIFFERGLCHGLLRIANGSGGVDPGDGDPAARGGSADKIAILKTPERCGLAVSGVVGDIEVAVEDLQGVAETTRETPIRCAAHFDLRGARVDVLDVNHAGGGDGAAADSADGSANAPPAG